MSLLGASMANGSRPSKTRIQPYSLAARGLKPLVEARRRSDLRGAGGDEACGGRLATMSRGSGGRWRRERARAHNACAPDPRPPLHYNWVGLVVGVGNMLLGQSGT